MEDNPNPDEINYSPFTLKIIKKRYKIPLLGCIIGMIITGWGIPFPFSLPLLLSLGMFATTLIIYRIKEYPKLQNLEFSYATVNQ